MKNRHKTEFSQNSVNFRNSWNFGKFLKFSVFFRKILCQNFRQYFPILHTLASNTLTKNIVITCIKIKNPSKKLTLNRLEILHSKLEILPNRLEILRSRLENLQTLSLHTCKHIWTISVVLLIKFEPIPTSYWPAKFFPKGWKFFKFDPNLRPNTYKIVQVNFVAL